MHARLVSELASRGTPVGAHDLIIAATAIPYGYAVAARDQRSFPKFRVLSFSRGDGAVYHDVKITAPSDI